MLLAIDVGNTETVLGVFRDEELASHWRTATHRERTPDELALTFSGLLEHRGLSLARDVTGVVLASVVPSLTQSLREMVRTELGFAPIVVEPGVKTGISILYDNPKDVGADRIANAVAAFDKFGGPSIVVDFGTSTNFDVVSVAGEYLGGVLATGLRVSAEALFGATARLPRVELAKPRAVVARNTVESLQSGLVYGTAAMVDGIVDRIVEEIGPSTVIATGGLAEVVVAECARVQHLEPWLTLEGLRIIHGRNGGVDG